MTTYPYEDAATRFRLIQYTPYLMENGIDVHFSTIMSNELYRAKNRTGSCWTIVKTIWLLVSLMLRIASLPRVLWYDVVLVQREVFPFFTPFFEWCVRKMARRLVFDFDDAVYTSPKGWKNWRDFLRNPSNVRFICGFSDVVIVGSMPLKKYAEQYSRSVVVLPTVYRASHEESRKQTNLIPVIGWIGSWTTCNNLELLRGVFEKIAAHRKFVLRLVGAKNVHAFNVPGVTIDYVEWSAENEQQMLGSFDIGIMPLYDNEWERGKCGFKLIQYMSLGIPVVGSDVGANRDIICDGQSGFLARSEKEWLEFMTTLIDDHELRRRFGVKGLEIARDKFSYEKNAASLLEILRGS